jgi:prophage regulatory protein
MTQLIPQIYRYDDLKRLFKISRASLARWELRGTFPKRVQMGENSIGWRSEEVHQWLEGRSNTKQEIK